MKTIRAFSTSGRILGDVTRPNYPGHVRINLFEKGLLAAGSAIMSIVDTSRHDMVAVCSETTAGDFFLNRLRMQMRSTPSGRQLLREKPRITEKSLDIERFATYPEKSFGAVYYRWLRRNKVTPDTRDPVRYIDDPELAYIMQRYRECHDFYHVLLGFGVSMPAEIVVKWFELANFGLPVALLSSVFGPIRLPAAERHRLMETYGPWALKCGYNAKPLIGMYWENEFTKDISELRKEYNITRPPVPFKDFRAEIRRMKEAQK